MYDYRNYINQDTNKKNDKEKILKDLSEIENAFKITSNLNTLDLKEKEYDNRSLEDIKTQAEQVLRDYQNSNKNSINENFEGQKNNLQTEINSSKIDADERKFKISEYVKEAKQNASDTAFKRGLSRSSIIVNQLAAFDDSQIKEFSKIDEEISKNVSELNSQIDLLEVQKQNALNNFDISYAVKLNDKINELSNDVQVYNEKVLEYNNKIAQQEKEYEDKQLKETEERNRDVYKFLNEFGGKSLEERLNTYKKEYVVSYINQMDKQDALDLLNESDEIKSVLGSFYNDFVKQVRNRSE